MGILLWIIFGALAGWIASVIMKTNNSQGTMMDIIMGILGSIVGGFLMGMVGQSGVNGFDLYSLIVAVIGAIVVIYVGRMIRNRR
ncbi:MAG: Transglycosylase-associated protein [Candidatus Shapirobacteria bacterium GW2011_GWE1_38_10]|uniref:Transglycosylase-associated protein n=1 Tax=Candidatus Shapirobacteria bacterium GW2011_GWE1_38_10 TaxID=1618488 RepID=A0A0G0IF72_9BACT|nr:MAG: Transglycosylase-associated protein [Candidatus Shapirobacteria bacterium GW2011_GWF2_37_20]KKQ49625.1 MAG: Transglycosylase-associated protein [Candidatus Shapirobacteria bacterium GW2011_GWE1_38_10]KKQ64603.1 MAG: Transglycosylase-associated protein [Candidatus Shapirobacteria bacterium GW2011_GWF1_38_23]